MAATHAIGIDLGTTYSAVAQLDVNGRTSMVRNSQGDVLTPSVVLFEDTEIVVGKEAKKAVGVEQDRVAECVKREMGSATFSQPIRGEHLPPEVIQSCVLRKLKKDTLAALGPDIQAVIAVPAYFDEPRRKATSDAGEMAGLEVLDIVNEPTAAALAFGEHLGYLDPRGAPRDDRTVLVYDLGGGTFDVTVVELRAGKIRTLATDGDVRLGGRDWDLRLADYLAAEFVKRHRDDPRQTPAGLARLMRIAEEAKHTLSARDQASVHIEHAGRACDVAVSRERFEALTEDLLERTAHTAREVLASAKVSWEQISQLLLVGGSTRMPMVSRMLKNLSALEPDRSIHPDEAVARGAAIYAGYLLSLRDEAGRRPQFEVVDVNAHSLGIEGIDQTNQRRENVILIPRNTPLPCRKTEKFVTKRAGQRSVVVQVLEGESKTPAQCSAVARAVMRKLPTDLPKGAPVEVTYEYGTNGRLSVKARLPGNARELNIELEREIGLSEERLKRWRLIVTSDQGFRAFETMLADVLNLQGPLTTTDSAVQVRGAEGPKLPAPMELDAAIDQAATGSPAMALQETAEARTPRPASYRWTRALLNVVGFVLFSCLGLVAGYYIVKYVAPDSELLKLKFPWSANIDAGTARPDEPSAGSP